MCDKNIKVIRCQYLLLKVSSVFASLTSSGIALQQIEPVTDIARAPTKVLVHGTTKALLSYALIRTSCLRVNGSNKCDIAEK